MRFTSQKPQKSAPNVTNTSLYCNNIAFFVAFSLFPLFALVKCSKVYFVNKRRIYDRYENDCKIEEIVCPYAEYDAIAQRCEHDGKHGEIAPSSAWHGDR